MSIDFWTEVIDTTDTSVGHNCWIYPPISPTKNEGGENKEKAFNIAKKLLDKKIFKIEEVKDFIELVESIEECL